jgi:hypothetical protein
VLANESGQELGMVKKEVLLKQEYFDDDESHFEFYVKTIQG